MLTNVPFMLKEASKIAKLLEDLDQRYYRLEIFSEYITMTDIEIYDEEDHTFYITITAKYKFYDEERIEYSIAIEDYDNLNEELVDTIDKDNITFGEMKAVLINTVTGKQED